MIILFSFPPLCRPGLFELRERKKKRGSAGPPVELRLDRTYKKNIRYTRSFRGSRKGGGKKKKTRQQIVGVVKTTEGGEKRGLRTREKGGGYSLSGRKKRGGLVETYLFPFQGRKGKGERRDVSRSHLDLTIFKEAPLLREKEDARSFTF